MQVAAQQLDQFQHSGGAGGDDTLQQQFPPATRTATEMVSRCTSIPTYLLPLSMRMHLVVESCGLIHRQLTPQGRPFIMHRKTGNLTLINTNYTESGR
jgi:hypothetical protein